MRPKVTIIILLLLSALAGAGTLPAIDDTVVVRDWLLCGPFSIGPREGVVGQVPEPARLDPGPGDTFRSPLVQGGIVTWREVQADSLGWLETDYPDVLWDSIMDFYGIAGLIAAGYAYAEFEVPRACRALALTHRCGFRLNGLAYTGDSYGRGWMRTPVKLDSGLNRVLLSISGFADRRVRFMLEPPGAPLRVVGADITAPDPVAGSSLDAPFGIPVLNTTAQWCDSIRLTVEHDTVLGETVFGRLPPLGVRKVPLRVQLPSLPPDTVPARLVVRARWQDSESVDTLELAVRDPDDTRRETFISAIDGSCQYYGIRYPSDFDPDRNYPVIFTLHGAGVEARGQANAYKQKDWAFVIAPTNRRPYGFDWQDWGRLDAIEVLDTVLARLPIDPDRVLLTGGSMGGHGCWHVATCHPDRFAVVAPQASWPTHQLYVPWFMQRSSVFAEPDQLAQRDAVLRSDNVPAMLPNLSNLPAFILHGGMDDNVPALHGRNFAVWLDELDYEYRYHEVPDRKHWWTYEDLDITVCDDTALMDYIRDRRRDPGPRHVRFRTGDLGTTREAYWVSIDRVLRTGRDAEIEAWASDSTVRVSTRNVAQLSLQLDERLFFPADVELEVNGQGLGTLKSLPARVTLHLAKGRWRMGQSRTGKLSKTPSFYGPARQAMFSPFLFVYGTADTALADWLRHTATQEAIRWWTRANGDPRVLPDSLVTPALVETHNLVLYGGPDCNRYTRRIARDLPIQVRDGEMSLGNRTLGTGLAALFVYPNPERPDRLVLVRMGTDRENTRLSSFWGITFSGAGVPDFMVFDRTVRRRAWAGVRAAGFFDPDWRIDPESAYIGE